LEGIGGTLATAATREERPTNEKEKEEEEEEEEEAGAVKWHYIDCGERAQKFVLKVSKLLPLISEQQEASFTPYICPLLPISRRQQILVLLVKSSFKMKTSMRHW